MSYKELLHSPIIPPHVVPLIQKAAHANVSVLIQGEAGSGKELIAKMIHHTGDWKDHRFHKIDCRVLTEDAFGTHLSRLFRELEQGAIPATLYLKEVGYLGQEDQVRLLELVEEGMFQNGDGRKGFKNLRIISSSSEDLKQKVVRGKFAEDLYCQLSPLSIHIPPLRDRTREISKIAQYLLAEHSSKMKIRRLGISEGVLVLLKSYWWPGNLRELGHVIMRSAIFSEGDQLMEKDLFFETDNEKNAFVSFLKKTEQKTSSVTPLDRRSSRRDQNNHFSSLFFMELVHRIKNPLVSIKTFTQLLREKFNDEEFREYFYRIVTEDIEKIDALLNGLLNYIKINTPMEKTNTVHFVLEEVLKKYEVQLEDRKIKVFKKLEKELPETVVHEEQLRYILTSLLQYAIPSIPPSGSIGFLTKSSPFERETGIDKGVAQKDGKYIEIMIVFTGFRKPAEPLESILGIPAIQPEEGVEFELRLIKEIIQKNGGKMTFEVNEKKPKTLIALKFPVERRKVIYYPSTNG
jgi:nitrogen-specific signal transduction histidine kinase